MRDEPPTGEFNVDDLVDKEGYWPRAQKPKTEPRRLMDIGRSSTPELAVQPIPVLYGGEHWHTAHTEHGVSVVVQLDTVRGPAILVHQVPWKQYAASNVFNFERLLLGMREIIYERVARGKLVP